MRQRLGEIRFAAGDILLLQAREDALQSSLNSLGCLPLASRGLSITTPRNVMLASAIFAITLASIAFGLLPAATALVTGALVMILVGLIPLGRIYESIDMPVIVLVAAMLPVGQALETTGGSQLIADALLELGQSLPAAATLALLMVAVMLISNVVNNAAAAVLAAPVAISLARGMDASVDPFLMAVAIGASCAFLPHRPPVQHPGDGARRLPFRRLLAAGTAIVDSGGALRGAGDSLDLATLNRDGTGRCRCSSPVSRP